MKERVSSSGTLACEKITGEIIGAAFEAYGELGYGFLEKVYQQAMQVELTHRGLTCERERPITVYYKRAVVGDYFADLFVEGQVVVEIKVDPEYNARHEAQLLNELKATGIKVGLLINFGRTKVEFRRLVF